MQVKCEFDIVGRARLQRCYSEFNAEYNHKKIVLIKLTKGSIKILSCICLSTQNIFAMFHTIVVLNLVNVFIFLRLMKDFPDNEEAYCAVARRPVDVLKARVTNGAEVPGI